MPPSAARARTTTPRATRSRRTSSPDVTSGSSEVDALEEDSVFVALGVALGAGFLIGFERQQSSESAGLPESTSMGGVRTYPLVALVGALATLVARAAGAWFVALAFAAVAALVAVSYADDVRRRREHGMTSEIAFLSAFLLGALATSKGIFATTRDMAL